MKYFVANWKANKDLEQASSWITHFIEKVSADKALTDRIASKEISVIVCPPFPLLETLKRHLSGSQISLGAQDVSAFEKGSYTGEVTARTLSGLVDYAIIGHSERRTYFGEADENLKKKVALCKNNGIAPILCVRGAGDKIFADAQVVAYEPVEAIGSGQNASVEDVVRMKAELNIASSQPFLYGGSVNKDTVAPYITHPDIDGVLVGGASLDPDEFYSLLITS